MPTNKNATLRYRTIDSLLSSPGGATIKDLINACEEALLAESGKPVKVSRVTIYKDLDFLKKLDGVEIERAEGKTARYMYSPSSKTFNGTMVSNQNYTDLKYALNYLESVSGLVRVDSTISRVKRQLDEEGNDMQKYISFESNPRLKNIEMLWPLYQHIRRNDPLKMKYVKAYETVIEVEIQPYYLKQYNDRWFLMAWRYREKGEDGQWTEQGQLRCYALDRIDPSEEGKPRIDVSRKRLTTLRLNTPGSKDYIDFDEYFSDIIGVTRKEGVEPVDIILKADLSSHGGKYDWNRLVTKPLHHSQTSEIEGDIGYVKLRVRPNKEMYSKLMAFENIEIVSPLEARDSMQKTLEKMLSHYTKVDR